MKPLSVLAFFSQREPLGFCLTLWASEIQDRGNNEWWRDQPPTAAIAPSKELAAQYMWCLNQEITTFLIRDFGKFKNVKGQDHASGVLLSLSWENRNWRIYLAPQVFTSGLPVEYAIEYLMKTYKKLAKQNTENSEPTQINQTPQKPTTKPSANETEKPLEKQITELEQKISELKKEKSVLDMRSLQGSQNNSRNINKMKQQDEEERAEQRNIYSELSEAYEVFKKEAGKTTEELADFEKIVEAAYQKLIEVGAANRKKLVEYTQQRNLQIEEFRNEEGRIMIQLNKAERELRKLREEFEKRKKRRVV